jgi:hypothetical protein
MKAQQISNQVFRGIVRNVNHQDINRICTFRLERQDENGDIAGYNVVEIYNVVTDIAAEGDSVEIFGNLRDGTIYPKNIHNLTTGKTLKPLSLKWLMRGILVIPILTTIFLIMFFFFLISGLSIPEVLDFFNRETSEGSINNDLGVQRSGQSQRLNPSLDVGFF